MLVMKWSVSYTGNYVHGYAGLPDRRPVTRHATLAGMDMTKMTRQEIVALLWLLAEFEREVLELVMQERREAEREGRLH